MAAVNLGAKFQNEKNVISVTEAFFYPLRIFPFSSVSQIMRVFIVVQLLIHKY